jgi:hypothetical protein
MSPRWSHPGGIKTKVFKTYGIFTRFDALFQTL